jgi:diacylglycerol kinase family enzyme
MYHIIVNPIAGRGRTPIRLAMLEKSFKELDLPYEVYITQSVMDGYRKAREICETQPNCPGIIGLGGDGTLQEISDGMFAAFHADDSHSGIIRPNGHKIPVPLGIFPAGSGNDFVMSLLGGKKTALARYKKNRLPEAAREFALSVKDKHIRTVDIITANGAAYMNIGNLGLDARIVKNALALKDRYGRYAYIAAVYKSIARHSNVPLIVEVNGEVIDDTFTLVAICNGQYYGGGLHIAPKAKIDGGKIMLCLVRSMSRPKTMLIFPSLMIEQHHRFKAVSFVECDEVKITLGEKAQATETLCLDGNLYPLTLAGQNPGQNFHFKIHPQLLDVFV